VKIALDTGVVVAGLLSWHEHHRPCLRLLQDGLQREQIVLPGAALLEAYAVMTGLPGGLHLPAPVARQVLDATFRGRAAVVGLGDPEIWWFLEEAGRASAGGAAAYDAQIAAAALKARATHLATLDGRRFERFVAGAMAILDPTRR
jgi:predicted nucleic acid-binding protein